MNFSEFKRLIGADPLNRDAETLRARNSDPEFEQAARDAEVFEKKLQSALLVTPPADLLANIQHISQQPARQNRWMPLALAASVLIAVGAVAVVWQQTHSWESVEAYVIDHYSHDGSSVLTRAESPVSDQEIAALTQKILSRLNASAGPALADQILYIKFCPTPEGRGAHMVVSTDQGPITVIFMPNTQVTNGEMIEFDQTHAFLVNLERGSVAIIGAVAQNVEHLETVIRQSFSTRPVRA